MSIDKNPYEKENEVNIPNFGDVDSSGTNPIFNMDTTGITQETGSFDLEEEAESSSKTAVIVLIIFLILFLIGSVTGWIFGLSKSREASSVLEEFNAYKVKTQSQITQLENENASLKSQGVSTEGNADGSGNTTDSSSENNQSTASTSGAVYTIKAQGGLNVRSSAGGTSYADFSKLKDSVKNIVSNDGGSVSIPEGTKVTVTSTKDVNGQTWGQIDDAAWICLVYSDGSVFASK